MANPYTYQQEDRVIVDIDMVRALAALGCTYEEIGRLAANVSRDSFYKLRQKRPEIQEAIDEGQANLHKSIRMAQVKAGVDEGNVQMLIHLGKHYLDQKEKMEVSQETKSKVVVEFGEEAKPDGDITTKAA